MRLKTLPFFLMAFLFVQVHAQVEITSPVSMRLVVEGTQKARKVLIEFRTDEVFECANFTLPVEKSFNGKKASIKIGDVQEPGNCEEGLAKAKGRADISDIPEGEFSAKVSINRQTFKITITRKKNYIDVKCDEKYKLLKITNTRLYFIPSNTIWGLATYETEVFKQDIPRLKSELIALGAMVPEKMYPGYYGDFSLLAKGETQQHKIAADQFEYPLVFTYTGDLSKFQKVLDGFKEQFGDALKISLRNLAGDEINSWD